MKAEYVLKEVFRKGEISFLVPENEGAKERLREVLGECKEKNNGYVLCSFSSPKRPRSLGMGSQNHHLNGHIMQICQETGNDYETIKAMVKIIVVEKMGYPFETFHSQIIPKRERDCNTEECAMLIEAAHILAAENEITLREA